MGTANAVVRAVPAATTMTATQETIGTRSDVLMMVVANQLMAAGAMVEAVDHLRTVDTANAVVKAVPAVTTWTAC